MYSNRVCQKLHDEHMATLALLERLERFVANNTPPTAADTSARSATAWAWRNLTTCGTS